jgi:hypothetical protein
MGGMYTDRAPAFAFVQASPKRPGAPSIAALSRWVGCTRTPLLLLPSFRPAPNARVPHSSQPYRDGWDVHGPRCCFRLRSGQPQTPGCPIHRGPIAMGGMYTDRAAAFGFVQASPKRPGAPSIAALSRWVGCTRTAPLLLPSFLLPFRPAPNARVPHPSRPYRDGWDVHGPRGCFCLRSCFYSGQPQTLGCPSIAALSRWVGCTPTALRLPCLLFCGAAEKSAFYTLLVILNAAKNPAFPTPPSF